MDIYLIKGDTTFQFPVNPEEIRVTGEKQLETVKITNLGEVEFPSGDRIGEIRFSSFFPKDYDTGYCRYVEIPTPEDALKTLLAMRDEGSPVRLIITELPVNLLVLVPEVSYWTSGGEPGDIYFETRFRAYREVKIRTVGETSASDQRARSDSKPTPKTYTVKPGDTLQTISKSQLGSMSKWRSVYDANRAVIGPDPNVLKIGAKLVMPA